MKWGVVFRSNLNGARQGLVLLIIIFAQKPLRAQAQESYYVVHVKGAITNTTSHEQLKVGDVIKATDKLSFRIGAATAVVMSTQKGRFTIGKQGQAQTSKASEFIGFVKQTIVPVTSVGNLSTRGDSDACTRNLKKVFGDGAFIFPDDMAIICLDHGAYPMNENSFFVYKTMSGADEKNYMIPFRGDSLIFEMRKFHSDGSSTNAKADIYHYDRLQNNSIKIASISPVYIPAQELKSEMEIMVRLLKNQSKTKDEIVELLVEYVESTYGGRTDAHMIERWLITQGILAL